MSNPYWPYYLGNTINFTYNGKEVWATILKFGKDFVTCITNDGYRTYSWNKMSVPVLYECKVSELIKAFQYHGDTRFKYLHDYYGPR
jgi:hypothetical protein